jgi:hypothetical protein
MGRERGSTRIRNRYFTDGSLFMSAENSPEAMGGMEHVDMDRKAGAVPDW